MADMMSSVDCAPVWSILDQQGTQNVMRSALGDAAKVADYETVKKRLLGSRYTMNFSSGVNFDLNVVTSDSMTAATVSSLVKAGMLLQENERQPAREDRRRQYHDRLRRFERGSSLSKRTTSNSSR